MKRAIHRHESPNIIQTTMDAYRKRTHTTSETKIVSVRLQREKRSLLPTHSNSFRASKYSGDGKRHVSRLIMSCSYEMYAIRRRATLSPHAHNGVLK